MTTAWESVPTPIRGDTYLVSLPGNGLKGAASPKTWAPGSAPHLQIGSPFPRGGRLRSGAPERGPSALLGSVRRGKLRLSCPVPIQRGRGAGLWSHSKEGRWQGRVAGAERVLTFLSGSSGP